MVSVELTQVLPCHSEILDIGQFFFFIEYIRQQSLNVIPWVTVNSMTADRNAVIAAE